MNLVALAGDLQVLDDRLHSDPKDDRRLGGGLASRDPEQTFALPIAEYRSDLRPRAWTETERATQGQRAYQFRQSEPRSR